MNTRRALAVLILLAACGPAGTPPWHDEAGYRWRELRVDGGSPGFTRVDDRSGIAFQNEVSDSAVLGNRILAQGAGVALGDVDGDGLVDVFLAKTEGSNALYRNLGGWRFEEIAGVAGVAAPDRTSSGATLTDLDGDGDLDLVLLATLGPNALYLNDGAGRFTERTDLGLSPTGRGGTTPTLADVDGDGDLDLYVANYKPFSVADSVPPQQKAFNQVVRELGPGRFEVQPQFERDFKLIMREDLGGVFLSMRADPDEFYRNEGGRFVHEPFPTGRFLDPHGAPIAADESFGLGAKFADLNGDGAPDLYVVNDFEDPDQFFVNDGTGTFHLVDWTVLRQTSNSGMAVDVADVDGDGLPDLYEVDMLGNDSRRLKTQMPTHTSAPKRPGDLESQVQMQRNTLFRNRGDGTFEEVSKYAGVQASGWSWSTMFMDVDLDGWQDILVGTGHAWDVMDADTQERLQNQLSAVSWRRHRWEFPELAIPNVAYRNRGDLTYEDVSVAWGFGIEDDISHTMAAGDLDGDGDLDVVINRLGKPALVLRNNAAAPRIAIRLVGDTPNTAAVGAKIRILGGAVPVQEREVVVGGLYMSHSDLLASFATGAADSVTIVVDWRDGRRSVLPGARPNRLYEITTATATGRVPSDSTSTSPVAALFADATTELGGHRHLEDSFDDWGRQFLLPNALGQFGPGVSWLDLDGDGDEDLVVGASKGGRIGVFHNQGGRLVPAPAHGLTAPADLTTILAVPGPGGATRVIAGVSTLQALEESEMTGQPAVVSIEVTGGRLAATASALVGSTESATGPLALADLEGDGDLDLFIGGRAIAMRYPEAASSGVFRNEGGTFVLDTAATASLRGIGMVSAATFADLDGDGDADLLLAREWGALALLLNDGAGGFTPAPASWGLDSWTSRWNGVTVGDLDGDGRLDIIATSWGRNTTLRADSLRPLQMVYGPFGSGGEVEMLLAREDARIGGVAPLNSYARARVAIRGLPTRIRSFHEYADATVEEVLGPLGAEVSWLRIRTLDHQVFMNRGDRFEARALPSETQLAPAFYAGVADFNGDGREDLFLGQNFFPTEIGSPRYDTGRGLLLLGDGAGELHAQSGTQSGILVYGDQRGAAYADPDGDGRLDLVVSQNGTSTRFFRNQGAAPGLRVRVVGPAANPTGVGAQIRLRYGQRMGPVREVQAGSGYWSQNGAVQVFGIPDAPTAVWVRWPGGEVTEVPVPAGAREVVVRR